MKINFGNSGLFSFFLKQQLAKEGKIIANVVQLLGEWAELFPYDFRDERMMAHVRTIAQKCVAVEPPVCSKNEETSKK